MTPAEENVKHGERKNAGEENPSADASSAVAASPRENNLREAALAAFIAEDELSLQLLEETRKVAAAGSTVLIQGESGTGKDLLASLLHYLGPHPEEPLVKIDCASLPYELLESELFGYERGAFTGATQMKRGRLELAGKGTVVLDEIVSLTLPMQAKLLRVLEEKVMDRLGGTRPIAIKARIIALSNLDIQGAVARQNFREDLYYRLNVLPLAIPPLRGRPADVVPIANKFLAQLGQTYRKPGLRLAPDAVAALRAYPYPGNVRELRNLLERTVVNAINPTISAFDLPAIVRDVTGIAQTWLTLEEMERSYILDTLNFTRGKKSKAAALLGVSRKTLIDKRKKYGIF